MKKLPRRRAATKTLLHVFSTSCDSLSQPCTFTRCRLLVITRSLFTKQSLVCLPW